GKINSDTLVLTLMYTPLPLVKPVATVKGNSVILRANVLDNPYRRRLEYAWTVGPENPVNVRISESRTSEATVAIPDARGKYYFNVTVMAGTDSATFQTYVIRNQDGLSAFSMETMFSAWIDDAVVYEITPYKFVDTGTYADITDKLSDLKTLGINTIWLQPVFKSHQRGQGYDVIDYFSVQPALGDEGQLKELVRTAKSLGLRVLFDVVPNHTSIHHPYARDYVAFGDQSHYAGFYQHRYDGAPYASFYHKDDNGFIYYFWKDLVNLDYDNEEVQRWMIEVCKYWLKKYDLDGYRLDAVWGVNARKPSFGKRLQTELKSIKPDILLLAEDKAADTAVYDKGFDVAYDWTADTTWVSQWSWQYAYDERDNLTIFRHPDEAGRGKKIMDAIFENGNVSDPKLRFLENNDLPRFITAHGVQQTRMAAALLFSLPGVPMLYNGQEIGFPVHPYSRGAMFKRDESIPMRDTTGLFDYYQKIIALRMNYSSLRSRNIAALPTAATGAVAAFRRWNAGEEIVVVINAGSRPEVLSLGDMLPDALPISVTDILTGAEFQRRGGDIRVTVGPADARWLLVKMR
ncbi:MAG TPA: alpha-amylase family glycosyl hydrolase, partial [Ohtaekwangia sp.]|nr:alpha-amylase family glycosyl hydrolase [Ohtaekwangia sp.]